ncbi:hypothetical protein M436DRAFT_79677 [Aureobasidium namibiae CBS 147.97]|uniref:Uncharacterized protein n=1 Tax=Aureobasidium namibiae CBS 147.97 TaxID=1043004 RepID=A0A074XL17_9PEZI|nr:uncharacterized protein M436DRAFT_79677 [Aureobasidium namibiae CBS 147.97]KEQ75261.1 hypothetical protein M436DRAFT_79677 [Aureobasidium namibiae CBS 147.97]
MASKGKASSSNDQAAAGPSNKRQKLPLAIRPGYVEKDTTLPPATKACFSMKLEIHSARQRQVESATSDSPAVVPSSSSVANPAEPANAGPNAVVQQPQPVETHIRTEPNTPIQNEHETAIQSGSSTTLQSGLNTAVHIQPTSETIMPTAMREHSAALNNHAAALDRQTAALNMRTRGSDDD